MSLKRYFAACFVAAFVLITSIPGASATFQVLSMAPTAGGGNVTAGLQGWWKFDDNTGTSAVDSSGNSNTGTLSGGTIPTWVAPGQIGTSMLNFGGIGYVDCGSSSTLDPAAITMSAWVRASSFPNAYNTVMGGSYAAGANYHQIFVKSNGKLAVYLSTDNSGTPAEVSYDGSGSITLSTSTWYFICATYDSTNGLVCKVNDSTDATVSALGPLRATPHPNFIVGNDIITAGRQWNGDIDDPRVYNRALTSAEQTIVYAYR